MKAGYAIELIHSEIGFSPFSNGSQGMAWADCNCDVCYRALACRSPNEYEQQISRDGGAKATLDGRNCFGEYALGVAWITGIIHPEISLWMGGTETRLPSECKHLNRDRDFDPDNDLPPNPRQTLIPFMCVSLFGFDDPNILVFDRALIEKDCLSLTAN